MADRRATRWHRSDLPRAVVGRRRAGVMGATRRLYLYLASGISLAVMASGAYMLLSLALRQAATGFGGRVLSGGSIRSELSLAIALVLVALPLWALHWYLATRG